LFDVPDPAAIDREAADRKMDLQIRAYNESGYDVMNIGLNDLALGVDFLKEYEELAEFPFISANIFDQSGERAFRPYAIIERDNFSIGIVGVTTGNYTVDELEYASVLESATQVLTEIQEDVDFTVLLASVFNQDADSLENHNPGYDLIVRSHTPYLSRILLPAGNGFFLETGDDGQYVQIVELQTNGSDAELSDLSNEKQRIRFIDSRLNMLKEEAGDQSIEEAFNEGMVEYINGLEQQREEVQGVINSSPNFIALDMLMLGPTVEDNAKWLQEVNEFNAFYDQLAGQN